MARFLGGLLLVLLVGFTAAAQDDLLTGFNLSDNEGTSDNAIAAFDSGGSLHVVWEDRSFSRGGDLLHRQLNTDGTWSGPVEIAAELEIQMAVSWRFIHQPDGSLCLYLHGAAVSSSPNTLGLYQTCYRNAAWSDLEFVVQSRGSQRDFSASYAPDGTLPVVYLTGAGDLYRYGSEELLSDGVFLATFPEFVVDANGGYHLIFTRQGRPYSVEYRYSADAGRTWSAAERLSDDAWVGEGTVGPTALAADAAGGVHMVYYCGGGIQYRRWTADTGWSPPVAVTINVNGSGFNSSSTTISLSIGPDNLAHLVWQGSGVFYARQLPDGRWTAPARLVTVYGGGVAPALAVGADSRAHVIWQNERDRNDLFYAAFDTASFSVPAALVEPSAAGRQFTETRRLLTDNSILLLEQPEVNARNAGSVMPGELEVLGSDPSGLWVQVVGSGGQPGWLPAYLTVRLVPAVTVDSLDVTVPANSLSLPGLFDAPDPATLLGAAKPGDTFTAVGRTDAGDWLQVRTAEGKTVWVSAPAVQPVVPGGDVMALPVVTP